MKDFIELNKQRIRQQSEKNQGTMKRSKSEVKTTLFGSTKLAAIKDAIVGTCLGSHR